MAYVYRRGERWYVRYKEARGEWCSRACTATTKTEAKRIAAELERTAERQRMGLEKAPAKDGGGPLRDLVSWWLETYLEGTPSYSRSVGTIRRHLIDSEFTDLPLVEVTAGR